MLDDNKIKSAAQGYCDATYGTLDTNPFIAEAFRKGAKWMREELLKDLCHTIEEKPKKGRVFLYKTRFGGYGINQIINGDEWKYIIRYQRATQWIYIDDILQKEGDNHD